MATHAPKNAEPRRWKPLLCVAGIGVGLLLIVCGLFWRTATTQESFWTEEQAREYKAASDALHAHGETGGAAPAEAGELNPEVAAARERFAQIQAELEEAQFARDKVGPLLVQIGLATAVAFGVGYLVTRATE
jgi:hypothetical protein